MSLIDKKIEKYGYFKTEEDRYGVRYEKVVTEYGYTSTLVVLHKANGCPIVQCYDKEVLCHNGDYLNRVDGISIGLFPFIYLKSIMMKRKYKW